MNANQIFKLDRDGLKKYCDSNNIAYRTKDGTEDIRKKALKALEAASAKPSKTTKPTPAKSAPIKATPAKKATPSKEVKAKISKVVASVTTNKTKAAPAKSKPAPKAKPVVKDSISFKQIGQNIILVIDNKQYSKKVIDKDTRDNVKFMVTEYNEENLPKVKAELIEMFSEIAKAHASKINNIKEDIKTSEKKLEDLKTQSTEELLAKITDPALKEALRQKIEGDIKEAPKAPVTEAPKTTRRGEY